MKSELVLHQLLLRLMEKNVFKKSSTYEEIILRLPRGQNKIGGISEHIYKKIVSCLFNTMPQLSCE